MFYILSALDDDDVFSFLQGPGHADTIFSCIQLLKKPYQLYMCEKFPTTAATAIHRYIHISIALVLDAAYDKFYMTRSINTLQICKHVNDITH